MFERFGVVSRPDFVADPVDLMEKPLRDKIFERAGTRDRTWDTSVSRREGFTAQAQQLPLTCGVVLIGFSFSLHAFVSHCLSLVPSFSTLLLSLALSL